MGLFTSLAMHSGSATVVYYDALQGQLRGAVADFPQNGALGAFAALPVACPAGDDVGQHVALAVSAGTLHVV